MISLNEFLINLWKWKIGFSEKEFEKRDKIDIDELYKTQWSKKFEQLMRNRLVMGSIRYGDIRTVTGYKYIPYLKQKLKKYEETGNLEMLVDIANLALLEFVKGDHSKKHWNPLDNEKHCEKNQRIK